MILLSFSILSIFGVIFHWILTLRGHFSDFFLQACLRVKLEPARSEKKVFFLRKPLAIIDLFVRRLSVGTRFRHCIAAVLGPERKNGLCYPLPLLFMAVGMIRNVRHSSSDCMRHSWLTQFGVFCLNQPASIVVAFLPNCRSYAAWTTEGEKKRRRRSVFWKAVAHAKR